jgi:hypothetical protein
MTNNILNSLDDIKKIVLTLQEDLKSKEEENMLLSKKNIDLEYDIKNLSKVSLVAGLTRQVDERNQRINLLENQIDKLKKASTKPNKFTVEDSEDEINESDEIQVEPGFELVSHEEKKLLKNLETRKLYFITDKGSKGKYAGKESKNGMIKLKD